MQLTYASHLQTVIQAVLADAETLGELNGPGVFFVKTDGDDPAYLEIRKQELPIDDPLDTPAAEQAVKAKSEKAAKEHDAAVKEAQKQAAAAAPKTAAAAPAQQAPQHTAPAAHTAPKPTHR